VHSLTRCPICECAEGANQHPDHERESLLGIKCLAESRFTDARPTDGNDRVKAPQIGGRCLDHARMVRVTGRQSADPLRRRGSALLCYNSAAVSECSLSPSRATLSERYTERCAV
jgi:hypothetical protein